MTKVERFNKKLGAEIRKCRKMLAISQEKLGARLGLHQAAIARVEKGSQAMTPFQLVTLAKFFGVPVNHLLNSDTHLEFFLIEDDETLAHAIKDHQDGGYSSVEEAYRDAHRCGSVSSLYRILSKGGVVMREEFSID